MGRNTASFQIAHLGGGFSLRLKIAPGEPFGSVKIAPGGELGSGLFLFKQLSNVVIHVIRKVFVLKMCVWWGVWLGQDCAWWGVWFRQDCPQPTPPGLSYLVTDGSVELSGVDSLGQHLG